MRRRSLQRPNWLIKWLHRWMSKQRNSKARSVYCSSKSRITSPIRISKRTLLAALITTLAREQPVVASAEEETSNSPKSGKIWRVEYSHVKGISPLLDRSPRTLKSFNKNSFKSVVKVSSHTRWCKIFKSNKRNSLKNLRYKKWLRSTKKVKRINNLCRSSKSKLRKSGPIWYSSSKSRRFRRSRVTSSQMKSTEQSKTLAKRWTKPSAWSTKTPT